MSGGLEGESFLIAAGYHGSAFYGSQIQPNGTTVQGEVQAALVDLEWGDRGVVRVSSRTDSGVSSRLNLIDLKLDDQLMNRLDSQMILRALGDRVSPDLCLWGARKRRSKIPVRVAKSRTYLYRLDMIKGWRSDSDPVILEQACELFIGNHDFSAFSKEDGDRSPIRTVDECDLWRGDDGYVIGFRITAESFLWNQVRKIASALMQVGRGSIDITEIERALGSPDKAPDFGRAPADALILWGIDHQDAPDSWSTKPPEIAAIPHPSHAEPRVVERWRIMALAEIRHLLESEWTRKLIQ